MGARMNPKSFATTIAAGAFLCAPATAQTGAADLANVPKAKAGPATAFLPADEAIPGAAAAAGELAPSHGGDRERYILKTDNSIVAGFIEDAQDHYCVRRSGSRMFLPKHMVQTVGDSMADLYEYRARRIPIRDLALRASLAQWCFDQGLVDLAFAEARLVLSQDPANPEALRIQRLCTPKPSPGSAESGDRPVSQKRPRHPEPSHVVAQFKRAYGNDLFHKFTDMQNLLIVSCGKGSCHGTRHDGPFKFYRRLDGSPGDVKLTSRNLLTLLNAIDYREPIRSPVLYKALERHGSAALPPLGGVQDPTYMKLQEWVLEVARRWAGNEIELDPRRLSPEEFGPYDEFGGGRPELQPIEITVRRTGRPQKPVLQPGADIAAIRSGPPLADDAPPKSAPRVESPPPSMDPYNPADFNRKKGGRDASRVVETRDGRPVVRRVVALPGVKEGTTFEAAAPPISLQPEDRPQASEPTEEQ
jgi:hypothetical protein